MAQSWQLAARTASSSKNKTLLLTAEQRFGEVYALAWSPAGTRLASGGQDFTVHDRLSL